MLRVTDIKDAKELAEKFERAVRAMRALNEHSGPLKLSFGEDLLVFGTMAALEVTPHDTSYMTILEQLRLTSRRQVGDLQDALKALGVSTDA